MGIKAAGGTADGKQGMESNGGEGQVCDIGGGQVRERGVGGQGRSNGAQVAQKKRKGEVELLIICSSQV